MKIDKYEIQNGPVAKTILKLAFPMFFGIMSMVAFNLADTYFVGQLGKNELAAMSFTFPVILILGSLALGLGMGVSSVASRAIGAGDHDHVIRLVTDGLLLAVAFVSIFVIIGVFTIDPLFKLLGAEGIVLDYIHEYMSIWYGGMIFVVVPMVGNNAIRATGDTFLPSMIMLLAVVLNITLDPLLIFGIGPFPRLGLSGAAIATVISRAATLTVSLSVLFFREKLIGFKNFSFKSMIDTWKSILFIGIPFASSQIIVPISLGFITRFVSEYGTEAVAAFGAGSRIEILGLSITRSIQTVLASPFIGQNFGAKKINRVLQGIRFSSVFALLYGILLYFLIILNSDFLSKVFNDDPSVIKYLKIYLTIAPLGFGLQGIFQMSIASMNVLNKPLQSALFSMIRMCILYIPLAWIGSKVFQLHGIFASGVIANFLAALISFLWLNKFLNNKINS